MLLDNEPVRSCLLLAVQADGYRIMTIEGVAPAPGEFSVVQDAFCEKHAMQCGYCTPAMLLSAHALLERNPKSDPRRYSRFPSRQLFAGVPAMVRSLKQSNSLLSGVQALTS